MEQLTVLSASTTSMLGWYPFFLKKLVIQSEVLLDKRLPISSPYQGMRTALTFQPLFPAVFWGKGKVDAWLSEHGWWNKGTEVIGTFTVGASTALIANPLDVVILGKRNMMSISDIIQSEGVGRFWKGTVPFGVRNGTFMLGLTSVYQTFSAPEGCFGSLPEEPRHAAAALTTAGTLNTLVAPLDVVSVVRQSPHYQSLSTWECTKQIVRKRGWSGLAVGLGNRIVCSTIEIYLFNKLLPIYGKLLGTRK